MDEPQTLEEWDADVQQLVEHIRARKIARNAFLPINRLSKEALLAIFAHYQALHCDEADAPRRWWPAHVCHQWRQLALAQPEFWQRISVWPDLSVEDLEKLLGRSADAPLIVRVVRGNSYSTGWRSLCRVLQELPRMRSLLVRGASCFGTSPYVLDALKSANAPHLSGLSVIPTRGEFYSSRSPEGLEMKQYDVVRRPTIREVSIALKTVPEHADLQAMLHALPQLETLRIWLHGSWEVVTSKLFVPDRIPLPRLESLYLSGSASVCTRLVHSFSIPSDCAVHVDLLPTQDKRTTDASSLGRDLAARFWGMCTTNNASGADDAHDTDKIKDVAEATHAEAEHTGEADDVGDVYNIEVPLLVIRCSEEFRPGYYYERPLAPLGLDFRPNTTLLASLRTGATRSGPLTLAISAEGQRVVDTLLHEVDAFCCTRRLVLDARGPAGKRVRWSELRRLEVLAFTHTPGNALWPHYLVGLLTRRVAQDAPTLLFPRLRTLHLPPVVFDEAWAWRVDVPWARKWPGPLCPLPDSGRARATLSVGWLEKVLRKRWADGAPVSTVVLTKPVGLRRRALRVLTGLIDAVVWNGERIDMSVDNAEWAEKDGDEVGGQGEDNNDENEGRGENGGQGQGEDEGGSEDEGGDGSGDERDELRYLIDTNSEYNAAYFRDLFRKTAFKADEAAPELEYIDAVI